MYWRERLRDSRTQRILTAVRELQTGDDLPVSAERIAAHLDDPMITPSTVYYLMAAAGDREDLPVSILSFPGRDGGYMVAEQEERVADVFAFKRLRMRIALTVLRRTRNRAVVPFVRQFIEPTDPERARTLVANLDTVIAQVAALV